jgi:hypothetical protein
VVRHIADAGSPVAASRSRDSASAAFLTPRDLLYARRRPFHAQPCDAILSHGQRSSRRSARASARDRGVCRIKATCVPVQAIIDNARDGFTAEQIATEIFTLPGDVVRRILRISTAQTCY